MRLFKSFALLSTFATYFLIFTGGLVRVSGAGLGCPDWPKCFGRWIPPVSLKQLPTEFDPATFNFTLAWIEYINRLIGVLVGLLILGTAILALIYFRKNARILVASLAAALLVAFQGWQGSQVVASELEPFIVSIHTITAFVIISLLIYIVQQVHLIENPTVLINARYPRGSAVLVGLLWLFTIVQVLFGARVRSAIEVEEINYPLYTAREWLVRIGSVDDIHMVLGIFLTVAAAVTGLYIIKKSKTTPSALIQAVWSMLFILCVQIVFGFVLMFAGLPSLMRLFHLWVASLLIGILLFMFTVIKSGEETAYAK